MKLTIDKDALYPYYWMTESTNAYSGRDVEVSEDIYKRYEEIQTLFRGMQEELQTLYENPD